MISPAEQRYTRADLILHVRTSSKPNEHTANTPKIDRCVIRQPQNDLGSAIIPALNVRENAAAGVAGAPEIDQLDITPIMFSEQDVLRFDIGVNDSVFVGVNVAESGEELSEE